MNGSSIPVRVAAYFDACAGDYTERARRGLWSRLRQRELRAVLTCLDGLAGASVLEVGCGSGFYTDHLRWLAPARLVACDLSLKMLLAGRVPNVACADLAWLPFRGPFDVMLCAGALEFVTEPERFFQETARLLSVDGRLVLLAPRWGWAGALYRFFHARHGLSVRLFREQELIQMGHAAGLRHLQTLRPTSFALVICMSMASR